MNIYHVRQQLRMKSIYDMNLRFVYYARVSSDKEEQKNSIINQRLYYEQFIKNIIPEQHTVFYRHLRSFDGHKMPIEYIYNIAI